MPDITNTDEWRLHKEILASLNFEYAAPHNQHKSIVGEADRLMRLIQIYYIKKTKVTSLIASLEVKSLPSEDPELRYWQGYHQAQLDITDALGLSARGEQPSE